MKNQLLIIEDNENSFFSTKQMLEAQFKLPVRLVQIQKESELSEILAAFRPSDVLLRHEGSIFDIFNYIKRRRVNRLNADVTLVATPCLPYEMRRLLNKARQGNRSRWSAAA